MLIPRDFGGGTLGGLVSMRAQAAPDKVAVLNGEREITYAQLSREGTAIAAAYLALGLVKGDVAGLFLTNRPEYLALGIGGSRAGLVGLTINLAYKADFLAYTIDHSEAKVLVTEARLGDVLLTMDAVPPSVRTIVYLDGVPESVPAGVEVISWEQFLNLGDADPDLPEVGPADTAGILYTSGTTGRSKGVVCPSLMGLVMGREIATALGTTSSDRLHTSLPLFHGAAYVASFVHAMYAGATLILSPSYFSVSRFWPEIRETGATQFNALGSILPMLLSAPSSDEDRDHAVTRVFAAPAPPEVLYRFEERFGVHIVEGYGMTEIKNVTYNPLQGRRVGSMGRPTATSIVEIHDADGHRLPSGQVGEIVYRPRIPDIMLKRYHRNAEATVENMRGLWWRTGDLGWVDEEGFFYYHDRKKDSLRRRGENISSSEVEAVLSSYEGVTEAAAIGVRSELGEQEVMIVFESSQAEGLDFAELFAHCDDRMPHFMVPRYFRIVDSLPRTPTGKVQKAALRDEGVTTDTWDSEAAGLKPTRNV